MNAKGWGLITGLTLALAACGGSDDGDGEPAGADAMPEYPATELSCTGGVDEDHDGATDCEDEDCLGEVAIAGNCVNEADLAIYGQLDGNVEWNKCVPGAPSGMGCLADVACNTACVSANTGLSMECSSCFGELVACLIGNCAGVCGNGGGTPECSACVEQSCGEGYRGCFGALTCSYEYGCRDTADNDGDGLIDAADDDCQ